jgi:hypothetical protein
VTAHHYLHTAPDPRTRPLAYVVLLGSEPVGCLWFGRPEATRCYVGGLTYGSLADVRAGKACYDRWEILCLSRVWLSPDVQQGGRLCQPGTVPGFTDRTGRWHSSLASAVVRLALGQVNADYLLARPPCFLEEPYHLRVVMSYCDRAKHRGVIYRAAGFRLARVNAAGIETWWTDAVAPLTAEQDRAVRELAAVHPRSVRLRNERRSLFEGVSA